MLFYSFCKSLLIGVCKLLMFNIITNKIGLHSLFAHLLSLGLIALLFLISLLLSLLPAHIKHQVQTDKILRLARVFLGNAKSIAFLIYRSMFKTFKVSYRHIPQMLHLCILVSLLLTSICITALGS